LRILQVAYRSDIYGGEKILFNLAKHLKIKGHDVLATCPSNGPLVEALRDQGIKVEIIPIKKTFDLMGALRLRNLIIREGVDVLHTHGMLVNIVGRIASRISRVHVSVSTVQLTRELASGGRAKNIHQWLKGKYYRALDNITAGVNNRVIAVSNSVKLDLIQQGVSPSKITVINNSIEIEPWQGRLDENHKTKKKEELGIENGPVVGTIARLSPQKDIYTLLHAISNVVREFPGLRCLIVGDGDQRRELEDLSHRLELNGNVIFLGYRDDVREILEIFDVFVLSSLWEGFPLVVLEAMAASKPVVATKVPGTAEAVVDDETGLLVPLRHSGKLADSIKRLLRDKNLSQNMGKAGRRRVEKYFNVAKMVDDTEMLYKDLMKSKRFN
jgi:glycosyltransferase involved in cell wall biosynthesis